MLHTLLLTVHIAAGTAGLLVGPAAIAAARRDERRSAAAGVYLAAVTTLTITAAGLVALRPGALWPFLLLAAGTEAAVVAARRSGKYGSHVRLTCGSYVSLVTALLVVSWGSVLAWVLPTIVGTVLLERAASYPPPTTPSKIFS